MYLVGCFYNFCDLHHSLRLKLSVGSFGYRWVQRTPAIASRLTDHQWAPAELFNFKVPPPRWELPKQRGRPSTLSFNCPTMGSLTTVKGGDTDAVL